MNLSSKILSAALMTAATPWLIAPAAAAPMSSPLALHNAAAPSVETVQYRGWRGGFRGRALGGLAAGAIIGGAIAASRPYGYYGYGGYEPGYYAYGSGSGYGSTYGYGSSYAYEPGYGEGYVAVSPGGAGSVAYCQQRFRSYDRASGTYLGFDGLRHPCP